MQQFSKVFLTGTILSVYWSAKFLFLVCPLILCSVASGQVGVMALFVAVLWAAYWLNVKKGTKMWNIYSSLVLIFYPIWLGLLFDAPLYHGYLLLAGAWILFLKLATNALQDFVK